MQREAGLRRHKSRRRNTEVGGEPMDTQRALYVYSNGQGHYTIARQARGEFLSQIAGPFTIREVLWWARDKGVIALFPTQSEELHGVKIQYP